MIPKRPKQKASFYRSKAYKAELRLKFYKWSHIKAANVWYTMFTTAYNPYALDWMGSGRTKVMQCRANAMFDSMMRMLSNMALALHCMTLVLPLPIQSSA